MSKFEILYEYSDRAGAVGNTQYAETIVEANNIAEAMRSFYYDWYSLEQQNIYTNPIINTIYDENDECLYRNGEDDIPVGGMNIDSFNDRDLIVNCDGKYYYTYPESVLE